MDFLVSILASLVAGILLVWGTAIASDRARWVLTAVLSRLLDTDIEFVFKSGNAAEGDIAKEVSRATWVKHLAGRGNGIQHDFLSDYFAGDGPNRRVRILLPDTSSEEGGRWVKAREEELASFDQAFGSNLLTSQIENTKNFLERHLVTGRIELREYAIPHIGRLILTDRCAFFSPYRANSHGRYSSVIKYRRGGDMYEFLNRLFDQLWNAPGIVQPTQADSASAAVPQQIAQSAAGAQR